MEREMTREDYVEILKIACDELKEQAHDIVFNNPKNTTHMTIKIFIDADSLMHYEVETNHYLRKAGGELIKRLYAEEKK